MQFITAFFCSIALMESFYAKPGGKRREKYAGKMRRRKGPRRTRLLVRKSNVTELHNYTSVMLSSDNYKKRLLLGVVDEVHYFLIGKMTTSR